MAITTNSLNGDSLRRDRKNKAFWGVFLMASVALFFGRLTGTEYVGLLWPVFGLYMAGNVGAGWKKEDKQ